MLLMVSVAVLSGCATTVKRAVRGVVVQKLDAVLPSEENDRSVWLSAHVDTEQSKFNSSTTRDWRRNYGVFSKALLEKAASSEFDSESLSKVLKLILADTAGQPVAYIPIAAYVTQLQGEPVWIVVVHWEYFFGAEDPIPVRPLSHVRIYAFTQDHPKQVAFLTCS